MVLLAICQKVINMVTGGVIRRFLCVHIFKKSGKYINVERKAWFSSGVDIELGDYSNLGANIEIL